MVMYCIPNWWLDFRGDRVHVLEGVQTAQKQYLGNSKWSTPPEARYLCFQKVVERGPIIITNLKQWKKKRQDLEVVVGQEQFLLTPGNFIGYSAGFGESGQLQKLFQMS